MAGTKSVSKQMHIKHYRKAKDKTKCMENSISRVCEVWVHPWNQDVMAG